MSLGCGTIANPKCDGHMKGTAMAASGSGKRHTLPTNPAHTWHSGGRLTAGRNEDGKDDIEAHWSVNQPRVPTRLWGKAKQTRWGGLELVEDSQGWTTGEYWNVDSNINVWGAHEVRRNAAAANHDVHRHDQIRQPVLKYGSWETREFKPRRSMSGIASEGGSFLEAWGFDLGKRDRQGHPVPHWNPNASCEHFRAARSFDHDLDGITETYRFLRRSASSPGTSLAPGSSVSVVNTKSTMLNTIGDNHTGRHFGSKSCRGWDGADHAVKREAAKLALSVHSCPESDVNVELRPSAVYSRKYRDPPAKVVSTRKRVAQNNDAQ